MSKRSVRSIPSIVVLMAVLVAACGPSAAANADATASPALSEPLDCVTEGYACAWSEVSDEIATRSRALAGEAATKVAADGTTSTAAAWLESQDGVSSVSEGDGVIRFMLEGGRPVWVSVGSKGGEAMAGASIRTHLASAGDPLAGYPAAQTSGPGSKPSGPSFESLNRGALSKVVGEDREAKTAIVLAPFGYHDMEAGEIAGLLNDTRGYEGHVTYLENVTFESENVTLDTLANLDGNDVVYIDSFGGTTKPNAEEPAHGFIAVREVGDDFHITDAQNVGLDIVMLENRGWYLAVTTDFFRGLYPGGLRDCLIFLNVDRVTDKALIWAIKGGSSELYAWDGDIQSEAAKAPIARYIEDLSATGRSTAVVYHEMAAQMVVGGTTFVGYTPTGRAGVRIRETPWLRNPDGGGPLSDGDEIVVLGELGDGEPDTIKWMVDIDGVFGEEPEHTSMVIYIDTLEAGSKLVSELEQIDDYTFRADGEFELPYDLEEGDELTLEAVVNLPEGGPSRHTLTVDVTDNSDIGTIWKGEATVTSNTLWDGVTITKTATIEFTRDRDEEPDAKKVTFKVTAGSMTWLMAGGDGTCSYAGGPYVVPLTQGDRGGLTFDLTEPGIITYFGDAEVASGPQVEVSVVCGDDDRSFVTRADGRVWNAPMDLEWVMDGPSISGTYRMDAAITGTYTWTFTKVR